MTSRRDPDSRLEIMRYHDARLRRHGDTARGCGWSDEEDRQARCAMILDLLARDAAGPAELLDFACGTGELFRHLRQREIPGITYKGVDPSPLALRHAREKFPQARLLRLDIFQAGEGELAGLQADYCIVNGLFRRRCRLADDEMWDFMAAVIGRLWPLAGRALIFNFLAKPGGRDGEDPFHVSLDRMAVLLGELAGEAVSFHAGQGLQDYTCYVGKQPRTGRIAPSERSPPRSADAGMVCRPLLPAARRLLPHLEEIDRQRWYSNFGQTVGRFTAGAAARLGCQDGQCATASSGTAALAAALIATAGYAGPERPYCLMPSYTFVATAAAALNAGYRPYFVDVDGQSLALHPSRLRGHGMLARAGAIIVVAPYGHPVALREWEELSRACGVPVVIDAAAGFDAIAADPAARLGALPVILSLHATKVFGVGEGGLILCRDAEVVRRCIRALNFGFFGSREALVAGFNGKMSEYHAAVGLAALDLWPQVRAGFLESAELYHRAARRLGLGDRIVAETAFASNYVLYRADTMAEAAAAQEALTGAGIDFRLWYGLGCHRHPAYADCPRDPLPVTREIAPRVIGLPMAVDLSQSAIERTVSVLASL